MAQEQQSMSLFIQWCTCINTWIVHYMSGHSLRCDICRNSDLFSSGRNLLRDAQHEHEKHTNNAMHVRTDQQKIDLKFPLNLKSHFSEWLYLIREFLTDEWHDQRGLPHFGCEEKEVHNDHCVLGLLIAPND